MSQSVGDAGARLRERVAASTKCATPRPAKPPRHAHHPITRHPSAAPSRRLGPALVKLQMQLLLPLLVLPILLQAQLSLTYAQASDLVDRAVQQTEQDGGALHLPFAARGHSPRAGLSVIDRIGGPTTSAAVLSGRAYLVSSHRIAAVDVSDPTRPQLESRDLVPDVDAWSITAYGDHLLVGADHPPGLIVYAPAEDGSLQRVASLPDIGAKVDVAAAGTLAYACTDEGLRVVDIASPAEARVIGQVDSPGGFRQCLASAGSTVAMRNILGRPVLVDASDPRAPQLGRTLNLMDTEVYALADDTLYVVDKGTFDTFKLWAFGVSDPSHELWLGSVSLPGGDGYSAMALVDDFVFIAGFESLVVCDASDPQDIRLAQSLALTDSPSSAAHGENGSLVLSGTGLVIVDATVPSEPRIDAQLDRLTLVSGHRITAAGRSGFVSDAERRAVYPLRALGTARIEIGPAISTQDTLVDIAMSNDMLYILYQDELHIYDAGAPLAPRPLGHEAPVKFGPAWAEGVA